MNTKHTHGPWTAHDIKTKPASFRVCQDATYGNGSECEIAHIYSKPNAEANARLIAATPDLLEVVETLLAGAYKAANQDHYAVFTVEELAQARAVLAKAKGES